MSPPSREQAAAGQTSNQTTALCDRREPALPPSQKLEFTAAEIGALAHLYRGEVYRSTVWRTRLDSTTNWAVVTTGAALSAQYGSIALAHGARRPHRQRVFFSSWKPAVTGISTSGGTRTFAGDPELQKKLAPLGSYTNPMSPAEATGFVHKQQQTWQPILDDIAKNER